jgi:acetolactate synthase-1/2/3 large subunit
MDAGEAVAEALRAEGVERVYSVPGSHIHPIYEALRKTPSIQLVTCKLESNVSLMADAYGRLTGRPGVCLVTAGPGCLNSMAGVAQAYGAASPLVHLSGAVPLAARREAFHGVDDPAFVHEMFRRVTKWSARVERLADIPQVLAQAFCIARSGRPGPVHVELPRLSDYSDHILQREPAQLAPYRPLVSRFPPPDPGDVARFAHRLKQACAPVIAAGKGVLRRNATSELAALAAKLQAPVVFAQDAIGVIPESHPFSAGHFQHTRSHPLCIEMLAHCDLVLAVGLRAQTAEMEALEALASGRDLILAGFDDAADARYHGDDQRVADPKLFLAALLDALSDFQPAQDETRIAALARGRRELRASLEAQNAPHRADRPIHPGRLMEALAAVLDETAIVASDVGNCQIWARSALRIATPESLLQSGVWNAMGFALPTAMVAKMEFPQRDVIALAGDGALLMSIGDLPTAAEYGANIVVLVLNDGAFGQTWLQQQSLYGHAYGTVFRSPDFSRIAQACGFEGVRVTEPEQLEPALRQALQAAKQRPVLLEAMVARAPYPRL